MLKDLILKEIEMLETLGQEGIEYEKSYFRKGALYAFKRCLEYIDFEEGLQARE